ncbi:MAG TPA: tetratricopeptide repeat protein [Polyangiaceae bacterium]|jgi:TPR repeat protein|nr:tetratricopeptide repeat protein [Polyangiaceae bacterium]
MPKWLIWLPIWGTVGCAAGTPSSAPLSAVNPAAAVNASPASASTAPAKALSPATAAQSNPLTPTRKRDALLQRSCDLGSALGCNDLAVLVWSDTNRALLLLERACELGLQRGCTNLALMLAHDPSQHERTVRLLDEACSNSDPVACAKLGDALYGEPEASRSLSKAEASYEKACQLEEPDACVGAGWLQLRGEGTDKSSERAEQSFKFACDHQNFSGGAGLGYVLVGWGNSASETEQGAHWLRVACEHDSGFGCFMLANRVAAQHQRVTPEARELFAKACRLGVKPACTVGTAVDESARAPQNDEPSE